MNGGRNIAYLTVNVRYANGASFVKNAVVRITEGADTVYEYVVGEDGKTEDVMLEEGEEYTISVNAEGFVESNNQISGTATGNRYILIINMFPEYYLREGL